MIRRSPAERYVRYKLIRTPTIASEQLIEELADDLIFVPSRQYLERLRRGMTIPPVFRPTDLAHGTSQAFLRAQGVWSLCHPHQGTKQALALLRDVRPRRAVETLLAASAPDEIVLDVARNFLHLELSAEGLAEFTRYFFSVNLLTRQELSEYAKRLLDDPELAAVARLPPGDDTVARALFTIGVELPKVDDSRLLGGMMSVAALMHSVYLRDLPAGPAQSVALRHSSETILTLREARAASESGEDLMEEMERFRAETRAMENPSLLELQAGTPPIPVGLLVTGEADVDDAKRQPG